MHDEDYIWLNITEDPVPAVTPIPTFLHLCITNLAAGYIEYNFSSDQLLVPNILTLAAVLDSIPLEKDSPYLSVTLPLLFNVSANWVGYSAKNATEYMWQHYVNSTTTAAKMNPGLDVHGHPLDPNPPLLFMPDFSLADYIVSARLFTFFLNNACIPGTEEHALMVRMAATNPWPRPIPFFGYDDSWPFAGDIFEAETNCVEHHNMGQIASVGVNNLAYFASRPSFTGAIAPPLNAHPPTPFNASRTYVALIVGDGDNLAFLKSTRYTWMEERVKACAGAQPPCFPLLWTLSPHIRKIAPDWLRFYNAAVLATGADAFVLPPSGHLYAYPGEMEDGDASAFVLDTESDALAYNTTCSVDWEWLGTWGGALKHYFPRYAARGVVKGFFATNVPYLLPIVEFAENEYFKILNGTVVVFKPNEWRGTSGSSSPTLHPFLRNASEMAQSINSLPRGTVTQIYLTSDGGGELKDFFDLSLYLNEHVEIVGCSDAVQLAVASKQGGSR